MISGRSHHRTASILKKETHTVTPPRRALSLTGLSKFIHILFTAEGSDTAAASAGQTSAGSSSARTQGARMAAPFGRLRTPRCAVSAAVGLVLAAGVALPAAAHAAAAPPKWEILTFASPTNFTDPSLVDEAGQNLNVDSYVVIVKNIGEGPQSGEPLTITDSLPPGVSAHAIDFLSAQIETPGVQEFGNDPLAPNAIEDLCAMSASTATCVWPGPSFPVPLPPGFWLEMKVQVEVKPGLEGPLENSVTVSGGGAPDATATVENPISQPSLPFGFAHYDAAALAPDGSPVTQAGSVPFQLSSTFTFNTEAPLGHSPRSAKEPRVMTGELPPGLVGNPLAVKTCSLPQLAESNCPPESQVGTGLIWGPGAVEGYLPGPANGIIYNVAPSYGRPAGLGFDSHGITVLLTPSLPGGGRYRLRTSGTAFHHEAWKMVSLTFWGDPADHRHAAFGANCYGETGRWPANGDCPVPTAPKAFLRMPTSCSASPLPFGFSMDSWLEPDVFAYAETSLSALNGCNAVPFAPTITARPTTNLADSPAGLKVDLHLPQHFDEPEVIQTADLREATVTLPKGLAVNPSSANGLTACSEEQVGYKPGTSAPFEFSGTPAECPDAAKLGTVSIETPLLGHPLPENGEGVGGVYLATPFHNPFGSLLALYVTIDDPKSGIVIKLAGKVTPDPVTGQLTASFEENPQLPFQDFHLHFFGGAEGTLRTPATCGAYETTTSLTPWSAPESGPPATPHDEFQITGSASGSGACPTSPGAQENAPRFHAGTENTQAGAFSPFSLKLVREDGSQELAKIDTTLPPGLVGKLAGISECSDAQLAAAATSGHTGKEEQASPSCPANTEVGTVDVAAGAGPTPLHVQGHAYLAGPYKGAPLSLAIITPAVAGPFDLGTVVVRTALDVNPETAQIHAVSDQIPHILQGIPLDVRSVTLKMNRPNFTLNPTNCSELAFTGSALSVLNVAAPLTQRFQVGGCSALPFKPKLTLSLKGQMKRTGFPALRAVLTMKPGSANIASAQVTLPHSAFLGQSHIKNICTRVQFASNACPPGSVLGHARAITPLLDHPLEGPVYLRSSSHKLPDLVADLNGQIQIVLDGRVDAVNGRLRNTFEVVPDAPVTKFTLSLAGGKKSLIENSEDLCAKPHRALAVFTGQNGKVSQTEPVVTAKSCPKHHRGKPGHHKRHRHG